MKKIDLGQTVAILANVGVIAGIAFLAIEIQQNNQLLRAEAIGTMFDTRMFRIELQLENPELTALITKNRGRAPLTEEDMTTLRALHTRNLLGWQKDYFLFREGILDEEHMRANLFSMRYAFGGVNEQFSQLEHWETLWRDFADPAYRAFIEQCVITDCEEFPR